jgi:uncharacterized protein (DUF1501 family)
MCLHNQHTPKRSSKALPNKPDAHDLEHKQWNRRSFLQALGLATGGTFMLGNNPLTYANPSPLASAINMAEGDRIVLIVRLSGGNDGLNTIVPVYDYDTYAQKRPNIRIQEPLLTNLTPDFAIPSYLTSMEGLWGDGAMKVVNGVGYEDQNLSHFRGSDNWANTNPGVTDYTGWMGRYFEGKYPDFLLNPPEIPAAIQIGSIGNLIFDGLETNYAFTVANPERLYEIASNGYLHDVNNIPACTYGEQLEFMKGTTNTTFTYAGVIHEAFQRSFDTGAYTDTPLSKQLRVVSRLIKGNLGTKVYMVTLGGFDTHSGQPERHQELMMELGNSMKAFYDDLQSVGLEKDVLTMTISEFGRRVDENGSSGTDHGSASNMLLFGPGLEDNGMIGNHPDLQALDNRGNMKFDVDFRQVYSTIMKQWLCIEADVVDQALYGGYADLDLGFGCVESLIEEEENPEDTADFIHNAVYNDNGSTSIYINTPQAMHMDVKLYNILGQLVATLKNELMPEGVTSINIQEEAKMRLATGQYIYRIATIDKNYSRSVLLQ